MVLLDYSTSKRMPDDFISPTQQINNLSILPSSLLALYQKTTTLKREREKKWFDTGVYGRRQLIGWSLMQIIQNNEFSQSEIKCSVCITLLPIFLFRYYISLVSVSWLKRENSLLLYKTSASCYIVKSSTLFPLLNMTFHRLLVYLLCMVSAFCIIIPDLAVIEQYVLPVRENTQLVVSQN